MKLLRYGQSGLERPGLLDSDGLIRDLSHVIPDVHAATLTDASLAALRTLDIATLPVAVVRKVSGGLDPE